MNSVLKAQCKTTITITPFEQVQNKYREDNTYGTPYEVQAYVTPKHKIVVDRSGQYVTTNTYLIIDAEEAPKLSPLDLITTPTVSKREMISCQGYPKLYDSALDFWEVYL